MKSKYGIIFGSIVTILWIALILYFSSQPGESSNQQSENVHTIYDSLNAIFNFSDSSVYTAIESYVFDDLLGREDFTANDKVRKSAHFAIYFVLGILATYFGWAYTRKWLVAILIGIGLPITVAVVDEFYQGLIDRTSSITDVVLDSVGAAFGMCFCLLFIGVSQLIKKKKIT